MSRVKGKNTGPELRVRKVAHSQGLRFRLHRNTLPGTPDLVFPRRRIALFVHGCFWHRHVGCRKASDPGTRPEYWSNKFASNIARDSRVIAELEELGWRVVVIWECETKDSEALSRIIQERIANSSA